MKKILGLLLVTLSLLSVGCTSSSTTDKPILSVSLLPQKYFLEQIVGDLAEVHVLVPYGNNPEYYDPVPRDIAKLQDSRSFFAIGTLPFEQQWIRALPDSVEVINLAERLPHDLIFEHDGEHAHTHIHGDPHYWTSLVGGKAMAEAILAATIELFPENEAILRDNYERNIIPKFDEVKTLAEEVFGDSDSCAFVIYHPSLSLFASEWGLTQLVIEENGLEPTPRHLVQLIEKAREMDTRAVLIQEEFDTKNAENIARELGIEPLTIQPLAEDWVSEMKRLIEVFRKKR